VTPSSKTVPVLLTASQAAKVLGVRRERIWLWVQNDELTPTVYVGDQAAFDPAYIDQVAAARQVNPQQEADSAA
jgi:predicted DNA-binding transcriptional regulator AlpA